ncbi:penicillin-binding protein 4, partial [Shouchella clausii]
MTLIMLQNGERDHAYTQQLVKSIEQIMAGEEYDVPRPLETKKVIPLDPKKIETLLGKYRFASETEGSLDVDVYMEQDKLYMKLDNG